MLPAFVLKGKYMDFLLFLQNIRNDFFDVFFMAITHIGAFAAMTAFVILYWCIDKKYAKLVGSSYFLSGTIVQSIKVTFKIPRPFVRNTELFPVSSAVSGATGYSFPSGHTQSAVSAFIPTAFYFKKKKIMPIICVILTLLVMLSRMYLGVHTPADVITSFLITFIVCVFVYFFTEKKSTGKSAAYLPVIIFVLSVFSIIYAAVLYTENEIESTYLSDLVKSSGASIGYASGILLESKFCNFVESKDFKKGIIRTLPGISAALVIYLAKFIYSDSFILDTIRYFMLTFWVCFIYPMIFIGMEKKHEN